MNRKYTGILIIILGLAVIALILYFLFFFDFNKQNDLTENTNQAKTEENNTLPNTDTNKTNSTIVEIEKQPVLTQRELNENDLVKIASSFAERFGSYSNHSNFGNIRDLKIFMTKKMQVWADNFIANQSKDSYSDIYYGLTTKSISTEVENFDEESGVASILVNTQRRESAGTTNNTSTFYQDIVISFVKENSSWKVDSANWLNNN